MALTNFQKVQEFNRAFDMVNANEPAEYYCVTTDMLRRATMSYYSRVRRNVPAHVIKLRVDLIKEEVDELLTAIANNDMKEMRDAWADILYVTYGMGDVLGLPMDQLYMQHLESEYLLKNTRSNTLEFYKLLRQDLSTNFVNTKVVFPYLTAPDTSLATALTQQVQELATQSEEFTAYIESIAYHLCEIIKLVYVMVKSADFNADDDFAIVHDSNMSKLCATEEEAQQTVADYASKFAAGSSPYDSPYYYFLPRIGKYIVKNKSTGKALKSIKYKAVQWPAN